MGLARELALCSRTGKHLWALFLSFFLPPFARCHGWCYAVTWVVLNFAVFVDELAILNLLWPWSLGWIRRQLFCPQFFSRGLRFTSYLDSQRLRAFVSLEVISKLDSNFPWIQITFRKRKYKAQIPLSPKTGLVVLESRAHFPFCFLKDGATGRFLLDRAKGLFGLHQRKQVFLFVLQPPARSTFRPIWAHLARANFRPTKK